jgi:hypothetical protein
MTRDDINRMMRELRNRMVAPIPIRHSSEQLRYEAERFHRTIEELNILRQMLAAINEEREACADVCEGHYDTAQAARAIRARGGKK